jgi:DnaJ family protein C protein 2
MPHYHRASVSASRAVVKYPAGTGNRWVGIANYINMQLALEDPVTKDDCIAQYQRVQSKPAAVATANAATPVSPAVARAAATAATPAAAPEAAPTAAESKAQADGWTQEQQRQLEEGLKKYPATLDKNERWKLIAEGVMGKTRKECIERYKALRAAIQAKKGGQK